MHTYIHTCTYVHTCINTYTITHAQGTKLITKERHLSPNDEEDARALRLVNLTVEEERDTENT